MDSGALPLTGAAEPAVPAAEPSPRERWAQVESWPRRAQMAAHLVPAGACVLDLGCGARDLARYLPEGCVYVPADVVERTPDTIVVDLDKREFPDGRFDVVVVLGVLEYLAHVPWVLARARAAAPAMVLSYVTAGDDVTRRREMGWVNDFSEPQLMGLLSDAGWRVASRAVVKDRRPIHVQVMLACEAATPS